MQLPCISSVSRVRNLPEQRSTQGIEKLEEQENICQQIISRFLGCARKDNTSRFQQCPQGPNPVPTTWMWLQHQHIDPQYPKQPLPNVLPPLPRLHQQATDESERFQQEVYQEQRNLGDPLSSGQRRQIYTYHPPLPPPFWNLSHCHPD